MAPADRQINDLRAFYNGRRVCVTGGAGFIGGHLSAALLDLGAHVTIIDDLSATDGQYAGYLLESYPEHARFYFASILDPQALFDAVDGTEIVFHLAAMNSVPRSIEDPERCFQVNTMGSVRVAGAARAGGARRVVLASSSSIYGDEPTLPKVETMLPRPMSPYAASKLAAESVLRAWWHSYGLSGVCLRFFNVFGPRQPADSPYAGVVPAFLRALQSGGRPVIYGDGTQSRDFTPVACAVRATLLAGAADDSVSGQILNIGGARRITVRELADLLARVTDRIGVEPEFREPRKGDVPHSVADISRARSLLGYEPFKDLEEALAETAAWMSRNSSVAPV